MRLVRFAAVVALALAFVTAGTVIPSAPAMAALPTRNSYGADCHYDSSSRTVRLWWVENDKRNVLSGQDDGAASDGRCTTVPSSVPWLAVQVEQLIRNAKAIRLPMTQSDKGIQKIVPDLLDDGSGAFDVFLDGASAGSLAQTECRAVLWPRGSHQPFRTMAKMFVSGMPSTVPAADKQALLRVEVAHELVHVAQCAVKNDRLQISGSDLSGNWVEAVPQAFALADVGSQWTVGGCYSTTDLLSTDAFDVGEGYGQWPFWYALLGTQTGAAPYVAMLRDVIQSRPTKAHGREQLASVLRRRFSDAQISRALLFWDTAANFGATLASRAGTPITWPLSNTALGPYQPRGQLLEPPSGGSAQAALTIKPLTCLELDVPWPDGAQTLTVAAADPAGRLADSMAAGVDVAPGSSPDQPCGTDGARTVIPLVNGQFSVARPCSSRRGAPFLRVLLVNGAQTPVTMSVTATAS